MQLVRDDTAHDVKFFRHDALMFNSDVQKKKPFHLHRPLSAALTIQQDGTYSIRLDIAPFVGLSFLLLATVGYAHIYLV